MTDCQIHESDSTQIYFKYFMEVGTILQEQCWQQRAVDRHRVQKIYSAVV